MTVELVGAAPIQVGPNLTVLTMEGPSNRASAAAAGFAGRNLGVGAAVFAGLADLDATEEFRSITGSGGVVITQTSTTVNVDGSGVGAGPWSEAAGVIREVNLASQVCVGTAAPTGAEILSVDGDVRMEVGPAALGLTVVDNTDRELAHIDPTALTPAITLGRADTGSNFLIRVAQSSSAFIVQNPVAPLRYLWLAAGPSPVFSIGTQFGGVTPVQPVVTLVNIPANTNPAYWTRDNLGNFYTQWITATGSEELQFCDPDLDQDFSVLGQGAVSLGDAGASIGVLGAAPVVQQTALGTVAGFSAGVGAPVLVDSTFDGGVGGAAYTIGDVVRILKLFGYFSP